MGSFASPFSFPLGGDVVVVGGVSTVATLAFNVEQGASVTYEWLTDVMTSWSGKEQRVSLLALPRQRFKFTSILSDEQLRLVMAQLERHAPDGSAFLLGLAHEGLTVAEVTGFDVTMHTLLYADWAVTNQTVIIDNNGEIGTAVIQSITDETVTLDVDLSGTVAVPGARIMPGIPVYLDPQQSLSRYAVNAGQWTMTAIAASFRFGDSTTLPGINASLTTFESLPIWDVGIQTSEATQHIHAGTDMQDLGFSVKPLYRWDEAQWARSLRMESSGAAHQQWLKLFLHTVKGRARAFLLPSGQPDLLPIGDASSGTLTIDAASDYVSNWYPSLAHRRVALKKTDGTVAYRSVSAAIDNGDGTQSLTLSSSLAGALSHVELLEQVRLESDEATIQYAGGTATFDAIARVVQDAPADSASDYEDYEVSVQEATPIELYTLETSAGTLYLTSAAEDVEFSSQTYTAIPLSRGNVTPPRIGEGNELVVSMPVDHAAAQDLLANGIPQQVITLTIARIHSTAGSSRQIWRGNIIGATTDQQFVRVTSLRDHDDMLSIQLPLAKGSRKCQHQVYDAGCQATQLVNFTEILTINGRTVTVADAFPSDGWANGGDIIYTADERRSVVSQVGTTLTIDIPFRYVTVGASVVVRAGCDKTIDTCEAKFANVVNFGGEPQKPLSTNWLSPFTFGVRSRTP